jgi:hypothetical protein
MMTADNKHKIFFISLLLGFFPRRVLKGLNEHGTNKNHFIQLEVKKRGAAKILKRILNPTPGHQENNRHDGRGHNGTHDFMARAVEQITAQAGKGVEKKPHHQRHTRKAEIFHGHLSDWPPPIKVRR